METMSGGQCRPMQTLGAGHVEISFVDGGHFDQRGKRGEHAMNFLGILQIAMAMAVHENGVRTELGSGTQRHGGMHAELASLVGCGSDHSTFVALTSDD